ncbi:protein DENND6B-like [Acyrthosiphon pisum]|uniref:Uncharacterized protein n=1 Tax=Acyrthosiphon pisum TaxID=7029 RepID=A0A8R2JUM6_ACYPI|nr:protein DENND6B-like [Acyrthosiphon pisum]
MLSDWSQCICVVTFDLEFGPVVELVYPNDIKLSEEELTSVTWRFPTPILDAWESLNSMSSKSVLNLQILINSI